MNAMRGGAAPLSLALFMWCHAQVASGAYGSLEPIVTLERNWAYTEASGESEFNLVSRCRYPGWILFPSALSNHSNRDGDECRCFDHRFEAASKTCRQCLGSDNCGNTTMAFEGQCNVTCPVGMKPPPNGWQPATCVCDAGHLRDGTEGCPICPPGSYCADGFAAEACAPMYTSMAGSTMETNCTPTAVEVRFVADIAMNRSEFERQAESYKALVATKVGVQPGLVKILSVTDTDATSVLVRRRLLAAGVKVQTGVQVEPQQAANATSAVSGETLRAAVAEAGIPMQSVTDVQVVDPPRTPNTLGGPVATTPVTATTTPVTVATTPVTVATTTVTVATTPVRTDVAELRFTANLALSWEFIERYTEYTTAVATALEVEADAVYVTSYESEQQQQGQEQLQRRRLLQVSSVVTYLVAVQTTVSGVPGAVAGASAAELQTTLTGALEDAGMQTESVANIEVLTTESAATTPAPTEDDGLSMIAMVAAGAGAAVFLCAVCGCVLCYCAKDDTGDSFAYHQVDTGLPEGTGPGTVAGVRSIEVKINTCDI